MADYRKRAKAAFLESEAAAAVIGLRNCKTGSRRSRSSSSNLNHNDQGSVFIREWGRIGRPGQLRHVPTPTPPTLKGLGATKA